jgi:kinesin family protein 11
LAHHIQKADEQFNIAQALFHRIQSCDVLEENAVTSLQREFEAAHKSFKEETSSWGASLEMTCKTLCDKVASASTQQVTVLQEAILALYSLLDTTVLDVQGFLKDERQALRAMKDLAESSSHEKVSHLKQQNEILAQMLVNERKDAEASKSDLIQRVSDLLAEFMQKRDESLRGSVESLQNSNMEAKAILISTFGRQVDIHQDAMQRNTNLGSGLGRTGAQAEEAREDATNVQEQLDITF